MKKSLVSLLLNLRMAILLSSVIYSLTLFAQNTLSDEIERILETNNFEQGEIICNSITEADLQFFSDEALYDYHYLMAYIISPYAEEKGNIPNHELAIYHLKEAKKLCETALGTYSERYLDMMNGLGREYKNLNQYDEALAIYEEGIVKSMAIRDSLPQLFANLFMNTQECYEHLGRFHEVPNLLMEAWQFWDKDNEPFDFYNYWPLWKLRQYYDTYQMYDDAIKVSEMIVSFIKNKVDSNNMPMASELYMMGSTLCLAGKNEDGIDCYKKALEILRNISGTNNELYGFLTGNLLLKEIEMGILSEYPGRLKDIKEYGEKTANQNIYIDALYSVSNAFNKKGDYETALKINAELMKMTEAEHLRDIVLEQRSEIQYNREVMEDIPNLEKQFENQYGASEEWFEIAYNLASAYYITNELDKMLDILNNMYSAIKANNVIGKDLYYGILNDLYGVNLDQENYVAALQYALEKWHYVSTMTDVPEDIYFSAINDLVVAKLRSSKLGGIDSDLETCRNLCVNLYGDNSTEYSIYLHNVGRAYQLQGNLNEAKRNYLLANALHIKNVGKANPRTVQYLAEVEEQLVEEGLDL